MASSFGRSFRGLVLAARPVEQLRPQDSSPKTLRTVGSGAFNWRAAAERLPISIDVSNVAFSGRSQATS